MRSLCQLQVPLAQPHTLEHLVPSELAGMAALEQGWGWGLADLTGSGQHNRLGWFMECLRGPLPLPLHIPTHGPPHPQRSERIVIVNFKHEKAVSNLAETGFLSLHSWARLRPSGERQNTRA